MPTLRPDLPPLPPRIAALPIDERGPKRRHPLFGIWRQMVRRCHDPRAVKFNNYGGRGIVVCGRWREDFWTFVADIEATPGPRPSPEHTLDRMDNDGNYRPGNVRWATRREQARNMRRNRNLTARGKTQTLEDWAVETGIPKSTLFNRIARGWSDEAVIETPVQPKTDDNSLFPPGGRELCRERGLNPFTVASRLRRGWSFDRAVTTPAAVQKGGRGNG